MIELNKPYSTLELIEALNISVFTWEHSKKDILEYLKGYYLYYSEQSEQDKRKTNYIFTAQLEDFPGYSKASKMKEEKIKFFQKLILETIEKDNLQTAANIARIIEEKVQKKYKLKPTTIAVYTSQIMREMFKNNPNSNYTVRKVWSYKVDDNTYQRMNQQELDDLYLLFNPSTDEEKIKRLVDDYLNQRITPHEFEDLMQIPKTQYLQVLFDFSATHSGHFPIRASLYEQFSVVKDEKFTL